MLEHVIISVLFRHVKMCACYLFLCVVAAAVVLVRACAYVRGGEVRGREGERDGPLHVQATQSICSPL